MSLKLYMDVHVHRAITVGLRQRGVDVLTAQEDGSDRFDDRALLNRATAIGRVLFTQDEDFLSEAADRQQRGESFVGVIFGRQSEVTIAQYIADLELLAKACEPEEMIDRLQYLPLR